MHLDFNGEPILVTISMSIWKERSALKFNENIQKTDPAEFYHYKKTVKVNGETTKEPAVYDAANALPPLPSKVLRISITIPSIPKHAEEVLPTHYLLHVNEDKLASLGYNFARVIANVRI